MKAFLLAGVITLCLPGIARAHMNTPVPATVAVAAETPVDKHETDYHVWFEGVITGFLLGGAFGVIVAERRRARTLEKKSPA